MKILKIVVFRKQQFHGKWAQVLQPNFSEQVAESNKNPPNKAHHVGMFKQIFKIINEKQGNI